MADLFERLDRGRPSPPIKKTQETSPAQRLLDWLQRWPKDTISTRDMMLRGPYGLRKREHVLEAAERLVRNGWLVPLATRQYNAHVWRVVRRQVIDPTVASDSPLKLHESPLFPSQ